MAFAWSCWLAGRKKLDPQEGATASLDRPNFGQGSRVKAAPSTAGSKLLEELNNMRVNKETEKLLDFTREENTKRSDKTESKGAELEPKLAMALGPPRMSSKSHLCAGAFFCCAPCLPSFQYTPTIFPCGAHLVLQLQGATQVEAEFSPRPFPSCS